MIYDPNNRLTGVHNDLRRVVARAAEITTIPFIITEGLRSVERQKILVAKGASKTMNSRHITGHAIDFAAYIDMNGDGKASSSEVRWDFPLYGQIAKSFKQAATELRVPIVWGGDWARFRDGPHVELDRNFYP